MKIRKGDKVKILAGKDKGKIGPVIRVAPKDGKVIVEGINLVTKHRKPKKQGEKGVKVKISLPMDVSKVMLVCPKCGKETRVGAISGEGKKKSRQCKRCQGTI